MKIALTGADGLLGSNLTRELLAHGHEVRAMVHPASDAATLQGLPVETATGDILNAEFVHHALSDCETVIHCAASTAMWPARNPAVWAVNVQGTQNVISAVSRQSGARLVHVGSASSFGYGTRKNPGDETSPYAYRNIGLDYFDSKHRAQELVLQAVSEGRLDAVVVNPTFMFGPHDSGPGSGQLLVRFAALRTPFCPPGGRNFVHVRDVAKGILAAIVKGVAGRCYLLGHENLSFMELFSQLAHVAHQCPPVWNIPSQAMLMAGEIGSALAEVTGNPPALSRELAMGACTNTFYSPARAVQELGLPQTSVKQALQEAWDWLSQNGYMKGKKA